MLIIHNGDEYDMSVYYNLPLEDEIRAVLGAPLLSAGATFTFCII